MYPYWPLLAPVWRLLLAPVWMAPIGPGVNLSRARTLETGASPIDNWIGNSIAILWFCISTIVTELFMSSVKNKRCRIDRNLWRCNQLVAPKTMLLKESGINKLCWPGGCSKSCFANSAKKTSDVFTHLCSNDYADQNTQCVLGQYLSLKYATYNSWPWLQNNWQIGPNKNLRQMRWEWNLSTRGLRRVVKSNLQYHH